MQVHNAEAQVAFGIFSANRETAMGIEIDAAAVLGTKMDIVLAVLRNGFNGNGIDGISVRDHGLKLDSVGEIVPGLTAEKRAVIKDGTMFVRERDMVDGGIIFPVRVAVVKIQDVEFSVCLKGLGPGLADFHSRTGFRVRLHMLIYHKV